MKMRKTSLFFSSGEEMRRATRPIPVLGAIALCLGLSTASLANNPTPERATQEIRSYLENQFKEVTGLGFKEFRCDFPDSWPNSREFICFATDEESDRFIYRVIFKEGQDDPLVSMSQPASQLNPSGLAAISAPGDAFLLAFAEEDWEGALASVSKELREQLGLEGMRNILAPLKARLGTVSNPKVRFYANPRQGLHQLDYTLDSDQGKVLGRLRMIIDSENKPQILGFLVTAEPGTPLQAKLLEETGKAVLGQFFDQPISRIEGPLDSLQFIGENAELEVILEDGSRVMARVEQHGSTYDTDSNDYRFQVLDARTLIGLTLASGDKKVKAIDCPSDVTPDGGQLDCTVTFADESTTTFRLMRRGGEHRMAEAN